MLRARWARGQPIPTRAWSRGSSSRAAHGMTHQKGAVIVDVEFLAHHGQHIQDVLFDAVLRRSIEDALFLIQSIIYASDLLIINHCLCRISEINCAAKRHWMFKKT